MHNPTVITDVIVPAASYDLVQLSDLKMLLGLTTSDEDAYLQWVISQVSAAIAQACNRVFPAETCVTTFWPQRDGFPIAMLGAAPPAQLPRWPLISVAGVTETVNNQMVTLVVNVDYKIDWTNGKIYRLDTYGYPTKWYARQIVVSYQGGFTSIPADLAGAAAAWAKAVRAARTRDSAMKSERVTGVWEGSWMVGGAAMPDETAFVLGSYTQPLS